MKNDDDNVGRGATRLLFGLILTLGTIAEVLFSKTEHEPYEYLILFVMLIAGISLIHFGYDVDKEK